MADRSPDTSEEELKEVLDRIFSAPSSTAFDGPLTVDGNTVKDRHGKVVMVASGETMRMIQELAEKNNQSG